MSLKELEAEVRNGLKEDAPNDIFQDFELIGYTGNIYKTNIDYLVKVGEIELPFEDFCGGVRITGVGIKKLDLGGHKQDLQKQPNK